MDNGSVSLRVELLADDTADLDPAQAYIAPIGKTVDAIEARYELIAADHTAIAGRVGEEQEQGRHHQHHCAHDRLDDAAPHTFQLRLKRASRARNRRWPAAVGHLQAYDRPADRPPVSRSSWASAPFAKDSAAVPRFPAGSRRCSAASRATPAAPCSLPARPCR